MSMRIGCDMLHYAILEDEGTETTPPKWKKPVHAPGIMGITVNPNASSATAFYDDGPGDVAGTLGDIEVELRKNELTPQQRADLLGNTLDAEGGLLSSSNDTPPWVAVGYRTLKSNGTYKYEWLYKGKFLEPEAENETKGDSVEFQGDNITGNFAKLDHPITLADGTKKYPWKYHIDEDHNPESTLIPKWFTDVVFPVTAGKKD